MKKRQSSGYSGVIFDLFGTLVPPFRMREHTDMLRECAGILGITFEECFRVCEQTFPRLIRGEFTSIAEYFEWIVRSLGYQPNDSDLTKTQETYQLFTATGLEPMAGVLDVLDWLSSRDIRMGLLSNCGPDVPHIWNSLPIAKYFDHCVFSCLFQAVKPDPRTYGSALTALELEANETVFVGDGSDEELSGARRCGILPVLVSADLSNTYDSSRVDLKSWKGPTIQNLSELPEFLGSLGGL